MKQLPSPDNPKFGIITPIDYLEEFAIQSDFHLVLAHLVDTNEEYSSFYRRVSGIGDFILLDNSAYELKEPYAPERLVEIASKCKADAIVLPDYPGQNAELTINAAKEFAPIFKKEGFKTCFIPQAEPDNLYNWIKSYEWGKESEDIDILGISILAAPNALPHIPKAYARVVLTTILQDRGLFDFKKPHHYFGLNADPQVEIPALVKMRALSSFDSSGPLWQGLLGYEIANSQNATIVFNKPNQPVNFDYPKTDNLFILRRLQNNITRTKELLKM